MEKGTRNWTKEQQKDILDSEKGKAYDDNGRAFEGQHMRSVEKNPECQGNPDNIQFLTRKEHFEVHKGDWKIPSNWYYDPITKEFTDFGEESIIPCKVIELSEPILITKKINLESEKIITNSEQADTKNDETRIIIPREKEIGLQKRRKPNELPMNPAPSKVNHSSGNSKFKSGIKKDGKRYVSLLVIIQKKHLRRHWSFWKKLFLQ